MRNPFKRKYTMPDIADFFKHDNWMQYVINRLTGNNRRYVSDSDLFAAYYSTTFACIDRRSKAVAGTPWKLCTTKKTNSRSKILKTKEQDRIFSLQSLSQITKSAVQITEITSHPILDLLWQVSDIQNQYTLKQGIVSYGDIDGDCYLYLPKGENTSAYKGLPIEINFIMPQNMMPVIKKVGNKPSGMISHYIYKVGQEEIRFEKDEIIHFKYFNPNGGLNGYSPTRAAAESISLDKDMVDYLFDMIANKFRQEILLTSEGQLQQVTIESIQKQLLEYKKSKKKYTPILPGNLKPIPLSQAGKDLPFTENRKFEREQICMVFGVPITMFTRTSSRAERDTAKAEFAEYTIFPLCEQIQQELNQSFIPLWGDDSLFMVFDDPIPANRELEMSERETYAKNGILTIDEIRADMNLEPIGIDYPLINGQRIGESIEDQGKEFADAIRKELEK